MASRWDGHGNLGLDHGRLAEGAKHLFVTSHRKAAGYVQKPKHGDDVERLHSDRGRTGSPGK